MPFTKYATFDSAEILDIKGSKTQRREASLDKLSDFADYRTGDGYIYIRIRAISSRVNKNHDGWPTLELAGSPEILKRHQSAVSDGFTVEASGGNKEYGFATFVGKPFFVDHNNSDPKRARGVIRDSKFRVLDERTAKLDPYWSKKGIDKEHLPASEVELLIEADAKSFPRLASEILNGDIDGFSMGADVEKSKCSHCGHVATNAEEYCTHILAKGAEHDYKTADGSRTSKRSYENCYGIKFFEISAVFDPADETALAREVKAHQKEAADYGEHDPLDAWDLEAARPGNDHAYFQGPQGYAGDFTKDPVRDRGGTPKRNLVDDPRFLHSEGYETQPGIIDPHLGPGEMSEPNGNDVQTIGPNLPALQEMMPPMTPYRRLQGSTKEAENDLPQSFKVKAPDEVDTEREEHTCPVCGSQMEGETCDVCGHVDEPDGFDNPDLDKAKKIRDLMKEREEQASGIDGPQAQPGIQAPPPSGPSSAPGGQGTPAVAAPQRASATKTAPTASVTNEMHWTPMVSERTAARINQVEKPIVSNPTSITTNEPRTEVVTQNPSVPVTSAMLTAQRLMATAKRNQTGESMSTKTADGPTPPGDTAADKRVDVTGVGGVDQASNEEASKANAQVDVTGIGSTGVTDVGPDSTESLPTASESSDDSGFNTDKTTDDSGPTSTYGDKDGQHPGVTDPVTSDPFPASEDGVKKSYQVRAYEDGPLETLDQQGGATGLQGGKANQGVQPVAEQFGDRVNVLEPVTSPSNNSGPTDTWSGTDGNGVLRQQEPVTKDRQEWGGVPVPDVKLHTTHIISCFRLAEAEQELGLIAREDKFSRVAELEAQSPESVKSQLETLARVKTAGLAKLAQTRQARRLPSAFGRSTAAPDGFERIASDETVTKEAASDELLDAALFS